MAARVSSVTWASGGATMPPSGGHAKAPGAMRHGGGSVRGVKGRLRAALVNRGEGGDRVGVHLRRDPVLLGGVGGAVQALAALHFLGHVDRLACALVLAAQRGPRR